MVDRGRPVRLRQRDALVIGDGDDRHLAELVVDRLEIRDIEAAVEGRHVRCTEAPRHREVEVVDVPVDDVEITCGGRDLLELDHLVRQLVQDRLVQPQGAGRAGHVSFALVCESPLARVTSWPSLTSLLDQVADDPLGASVSGRWDALYQRCDLCNSHREHPSVQVLHEGHRTRRASAARDSQTATARKNRTPRIGALDPLARGSRRWARGRGGDGDG